MIIIGMHDRSLPLCHLSCNILDSLSSLLFSSSLLLIFFHLARAKGMCITPRLLCFLSTNTFLVECTVICSLMSDRSPCKVSLTRLSIYIFPLHSHLFASFAKRTCKQMETIIFSRCIVSILLIGWLKNW